MRRGLILLIVLLGAAGLAAAQELAYFEGTVRVYERVNGELFELQDSQDGLIDFGYKLDTNYVVKTFDGSAEVLLPNGHVLKLASNTEIQLDSVVPEGASSGTDVVSITGGRLRSVVASLTGTGRGFQVRTPTAVGGVRGTDFAVILDATNEIIAVKEGVVNFAKDNGQTLSLVANQFADALANSFVATTANVVDQFYGSLNQLSDQVMAARDAILAELPKPQESEEPKPADDQTVQSGDAVTVNPESPTPSSSEEPAPPSEGGPFDEMMANVADALGLEIGSISLEGQTYSKLVAQPTFEIGKLRAALYLPVIYSGNLFDWNDWYKPAGNNEWSFSTDQNWTGDPLGAFADLVGDIALKIKFIEWGNQRDDFFFKVGNLNTLTLGHGLLMQNYANDADFPAVRRVGFNVGYDFGPVGFEALTNDLAAPEIFGARVYARPIPNFALAIGASGVADIAPASNLPATATNGDPIFVDERAADPIFLNLALDLDLPIVESDLLTLVLFGDAGGLVPYLRHGVQSLDAGLQTQALYDPATGLRNYGIESGVFGNLAMIDYRLEFRNFHGVFQPAFYGSNYDRVKGEKVADVIAYLENPDASAYKNQTVGIYGGAGFSIMDLVRLDAGYLWPWTADPATGAITMGNDDHLYASLNIADGLLPLGITAGISYERNYFVPTLLGWSGFEQASLLDENTVLKGEVVYPVAPIMDIVASISTTVLRDGDGNIVYEYQNGVLKPKSSIVIGIETRIGASGF